MQVISIACLSLFSIFSKHPCARMQVYEMRDTGSGEEGERGTTVIRTRLIVHSSTVENSYTLLKRGAIRIGLFHPSVPFSFSLLS